MRVFHVYSHSLGAANRQQVLECYFEKRRLNFGRTWSFVRISRLGSSGERVGWSSFVSSAGIFIPVCSRTRSVKSSGGFRSGVHWVLIGFIELMKSMKLITCGAPLRPCRVKLDSILNFGPGEWLFVYSLWRTPKLKLGAIFFLGSWVALEVLPKRQFTSAFIDFAWYLHNRNCPVRKSEYTVKVWRCLLSRRILELVQYLTQKNGP